MVGNNLVIRNTSQDSAKGYDIKNNDLVEIIDCFAQDTGEMMYSADRLIGLVQAESGALQTAADVDAQLASASMTALIDAKKAHRETIKIAIQEATNQVKELVNQGGAQAIGLPSDTPMSVVLNSEEFFEMVAKVQDNNLALLLSNEQQILNEINRRSKITVNEEDLKGPEQK